MTDSKTALTVLPNEQADGQANVAGRRASVGACPTSVLSKVSSCYGALALYAGHAAFAAVAYAPSCE